MLLTTIRLDGCTCGRRETNSSAFLPKAFKAILLAVKCRFRF